MTLRFGFTPCPNDAFAFHALVHGLVPAPFEVEPVLLDIEELNRRAARDELELTKLSFGAAAAAGDRYRLLKSGAALGRGVGPLVVARQVDSLERAVAGRVAVPGRETTAFLLLRLAAPSIPTGAGRRSRGRRTTSSRATSSGTRCRRRTRRSRTTSPSRRETGTASTSSRSHARSC